MDDQKRFRAVYESLSFEDRCDSRNGMEYQRVLRDWVEAGKPSDMGAFIHQRANTPHDS